MVRPRYFLALLSGLSLGSPAVAAVVDTPTGPVEVPDAGAVQPAGAPMALASMETPAAPIRVAVYGVWGATQVLNAATGIEATNIGWLDAPTLAGFDCLVARVYGQVPPSFIEAVRQFVANGGCYIGEWWGAGWALGEEGPNYAYWYYAPSAFLGLFSGAASDGGYVGTGTPISIAQDHPVVAGLTDPFSAGGSTEFFVRAIPPYDPRLTSVATYQGYGGTYPAILAGRAGGGRVVLLLFDAGDSAPWEPAMQILWPNAVRWAAVRDEIPPVTDHAFAGMPGNPPWWLSDVVVTLSATDEGSGVATTEYRLDGSSWIAYSGPFTVSAEGQTTLCYRSTDLAGNVEAPRCATLFIDKTPPAIDIASPADQSVFLLRQPVLAEWSAADAVSGLAFAQGTAAPGELVDTASVGQKAFAVYARDVAGNEASLTSTYYVHYAFGGFRPPIVPDGSGIYRLGSTIPVKFQLFDYRGALVQDAWATLAVAKLSDVVTGSIMVDAVASGSANDGSFFRYDGFEAQYLYNLSTKNTALTTGTWELRASLSDGSTRTVAVSLR